MVDTEEEDFGAYQMTFVFRYSMTKYSGQNLALQYETFGFQFNICRQQFYADVNVGSSAIFKNIQL